MYYGQGFAGSATRRYAAVHAGSRIEGATPHGLVKILFDELLFALDAAVLAEQQQDRAKASDKLSRSIAILHALESSLDFDRGGDIATGLALIYREARRLILAGARAHSTDEVARARTMLAEIADAWNQIG
ncbi:MAG: flagellar export chaperone FliS [Sphingobium sp.]|nr:MAG: flagellar export chaperone FliS [Sphingobium sp.]